MLKNIDKNRIYRIVPYLVIVLLALIVYSNSFSVPYTLDDFSSIQDNYAIRNPLDFISIWKFYSNRFILYYTISLNYYIHGDIVEGYHIVNLLIHIINGILMYRILMNLLSLKSMTPRISKRYHRWIALMAAAIFIAHPVQVNAVTYIIQRTASLAAMFYMLALLFYIKFRKQGKLVYYFLTLIATIFAMFTKENTITIPFMLLLIEIMFFIKDKKIRWYKRILMFIPIMATIPIIPGTNLFLKGYSQSDPDVTFKASTSMDRFHYFYTQLNVVLHYIRQIIIPDNLNFDYSNDYPISESIWDNHSYISLAIHCLIGLVALLNLRRNKLISFGILWFYIGLSVESSFISIKDVYFEHRLYFPLAGFIMFITGLVFYRRNKGLGRTYIIKPMLLFTLLAVTMTIMYSAVTLHRNYIFSDPIRLWSDVVKKAPNSDRAHSVLATEYLNYYELRGGSKEYLDKAEAEFKKAIEIDYFNDTAHCNLAKVYLLKGDNENCIIEAKNANNISPSVYGYNNLGLAYKNLGDYYSAINAFREGYALDNRCSFIIENLADTFMDYGNYSQAKKYYEEYLKLYDNSSVEEKLKEVQERINSGEYIEEDY